MKKGIDVSSYQGNINWKKVKESGIDFAIIRLGYGDNLESQDDTEYLNNVNGCISNNIPFGVYLYSYALNLTGDSSIQSEVEHCKRQLDKINQKPFCVYIDIEDDNLIKLGEKELTNHVLYFGEKISSLGYKAGVYANQNWFNNYLNLEEIRNKKYNIWYALYNSNINNMPDICNIWQYSNTGKVNGINVNVDLDYMYSNIVDNNKSILELAEEVIEGKWGDGLERKKRLTESGYNYNEIQSKVDEILNNNSNTILYKVLPGDTLSAIASKYSTTVNSIVSLNKNKYPNISSNYIQSGWILTIPNNSTYYIVKRGDTLSLIARKYNTSWKKLAELNNIKGPDYIIYPGEQLKIS